MVAVSCDLKLLYGSEIMTHYFSKQRIVAGPGFNRWLVPPASIAIHLCIGSVYAWSLFNTPLTRVFGVVGSAADDWSLQQVVWIFTVAIVFLGFAAAFAGKWLERAGPRLVGSVAACCWGGGFLIGGLGIWLHQLWLVYLGYGALGGCGLGLGYVSPVSTLIRWFPDRRGMAAGLAIMGFGGGAIIGTPLKEWLLRYFTQLPQFLGRPDQLELLTENGRRLASVNGSLQEVLVIGTREASSSIPHGVYLVNTGTTGAAETFFVLGIVYFLIMIVAAFSYRIPADNWTPPGNRIPEKPMVSRHHVEIDQAMKTPQFYLVWIVLCFNVTAGIGVLGVAKTMIIEIFGTNLTISPGFAATYVLMISVFNMIGRFFWASASDYLGRKNTYTIFFVSGVILYLSIPFTAQRVSGSSVPGLLLVYFYAVTMLIFTMYGGGFATIPAYLADLFGTRFVGGIHGRLLTAWSTAGVLGPWAITSLREAARNKALHQLTQKIDSFQFHETFGASKEQLQQLIDAKTVTLPKLMEMVPEGTTDPSATLYNSTMFLMAILLAIALVANLFIQPVHPRHHIDES